jgi:hypothetical protein
MTESIKRHVRAWIPAQTYERGYRCADECIRQGESATVLRGQACGDLHPCAFTKGWKARCDAQKGGQE